MSQVRLRFGLIAIASGVTADFARIWGFGRFFTPYTAGKTAEESAA
jgi:hypothetical protein